MDSNLTVHCRCKPHEPGLTSEQRSAMEGTLTGAKRMAVELLNWEVDKEQTFAQTACVQLTQSIFDEHTAYNARYGPDHVAAPCPAVPCCLHAPPCPPPCHRCVPLCVSCRWSPDQKAMFEWYVGYLAGLLELGDDSQEKLRNLPFTLLVCTPPCLNAQWPL